MKAPASFRLFALLLVILAFFCFSQRVRAIENVFDEDFSQLSNSNWNINTNQGGIVEIQDNSLRLHSATSRYFPYVTYNGPTIPDEKYYIETRFKISGVLNYGSGVIFTDKLPVYGITSDVNASDVIFQIWPYNGSVGIWTTLCPNDLGGCVGGSYRLISTVSMNTWHEIKIYRSSDHKFTLYLDGVEYFNSSISNRNISKMWVGNPQTTSSQTTRADVYLDFLRISKEEQLITPVIVIPGFGGSWDIGAILSGGTGNNWEIPTFVKNYDGIIQSFKNAGYEEGTDLFVFPYDWRKSLDSLAEDLNTFINSKGTAGKFNLVGHSMGGLVARAYGQKYGVTKVDKILTAGSPHMGLVDMYGLWEGAMSWDNVWWQNVLLEIATEVNRQPNETKVAAIRRVSPSVIDLFPTFPFLLRDNVPVAITSMAQKNAYLSTLNQNTDILVDKLIPFWSEDIGSTRSTINTTARTEQEALSGQWEDGSPLGADPFSRTTGDGTVTKTSAVGPFGVGDKMVGWHADLLSNSDNIGKVFTKLGLDPLLAVSTTTDNRKNSFVAILRSPGVLEVCDKQLTKCNDQLGLYFPEHKLFILPGYDGSNLAVKIKEAGLGTYKLHLGSLDDSPNWVQEDGELKVVDQIDFYGVRSASVSISSTQDTTPPAVSITSPQEKSYQSANLPELTYSVNDDWDESPTIVASTMLQNEGLHTATVSATDDAGNTGQGSVKYTIDNTPPEISISSPKAETYERGKLPKLTYVVKDNWDTNPKVEVSGWSEAVGKHTVTVKATDEASNTKSVSVTYTVENPPTSSPLCKKDKGALYRMFHFKTQAACDKFLDQYHKWRWNNYFTFWRWFNR